MAGTVNPQLPLPTPSQPDTHSILRTFTSWANSLVSQLFTYGQRLNLCLPKDGSEAMMGALTTVGIINNITTITNSATLSQNGAATFGDTVTLHADPAANLEAATKQYVDGLTTGVVYPKVRAGQSASAQSISNATFTKVTLDSVAIDTNSNFASSRFTPTVAGYYRVYGQIYFGVNSANTAAVGITKNGTQINQGQAEQLLTMVNVSDIVQMNGSTDFLELVAFQSTGSSQSLSNSPEFTYFFAERIN